MSNETKTGSEQELTVQQALQRMQRDYANKGAVSSADLIKVLGDPSKGVSVTLPTGYANSMSKWGR